MASAVAPLRFRFLPLYLGGRRGFVEGRMRELRPCPELARREGGNANQTLIALGEHAREGLRRELIGIDDGAAGGGPIQEGEKKEQQPGGRGKKAEVKGQGRQGGEFRGEPGWVLGSEMEAKLRESFQAMDANRDGELTEEERNQATLHLDSLLMEFGVNGSVFHGLGGLDFEEFRARFAREWEIARKVQALSDSRNICLLRAAASCLPGGSPDSPLGALEAMTSEQIKEFAVGVLAPALESSLLEEKKSLLSFSRSRETSVNPEEKMTSTIKAGGGNSKFAMDSQEVRVAKFGSLDDFHFGMGKDIGLPNPKLLEGMESEHSKRRDSEQEFSPGNYDLTTTPVKEWGIVTDPAEGAKASVGERRVIPVAELMVHPTVVEAGLREEEVIALLLYTGPMFKKYNAVLRRFPQDTYEALLGNTYTTTIYCIVSGVIKLSKHMKLPADRLAYRGLGGMRLPEEFKVADKCGVRGGTEHAMMSTTLDRSVALQYAGQELPTIFEIQLGAIDRGASLSFLSQYPKEEEILIPPRSYLEVVGPSRIEIGAHGIQIRILTLKVNANMSSSTIEEIEGKRRDLFLSSAENALHDIKGKLQQQLDSERVPQLLQKLAYDRTNGRHFQLRDRILEDAEQWLKGHQEHTKEFFNDEWKYAGANRELTTIQQMAIGKFTHWLDGDGRYAVEHVIDVPLEHVSRTVVSQLMARLTRGGASSFRPGESGKDVAFELCRRRGALIDSIDEVNSSGEPPIVSSGAKGDIVDLKLLLLAGADVASTSKDGMTALHMASYMGHVEFVEHLFSAGADVMTTVGGHGDEPDSLWVRGSVVRRSTSLHLAAEMGHIEVCRRLLEGGGKDLLWMRDGKGRTCGLVAAFRGHYDVLRLFGDAGGKEFLEIPNDLGLTAAATASYWGHSEVLQYLVDICGSDLCMVVFPQDGGTCAHMAARNGHADCLRLLASTCGKALLSRARTNDGVTCAMVAAQDGHLEELRIIQQVCGPEFLVEKDKGGQACAHKAACGGHAAVLAHLVEACGEEVLSLRDDQGRTCADVAREEGHEEELGATLRGSGE